MKLLIVVVISILLAGCQNAAFSDPESPYYRFARATKVVVNRDVSIGPNRTSVWFQNGRILSGANEFYPYCRMYVYGTVNETRIVKPAEYAVKRWLRERLLVWHDGNPLMYASIMSSGGEQPSHVTWGVYFYLEGSGASQPRLLMCGQLGDWASGASRGYPTFAEMREALGSFVSIVERQTTLKLVHASFDGMLIDYLQQTLEARGIGCVARNRYLQGAVGELPVNECWPELWVLDDRDERLALDIVSALLQDGSGGEHWRCPGCGERMEGQFDQCWNCGMERPKPVGAR